MSIFFLFYFREGVTKCSKEVRVYDKFIDIRQHNKYLLEYLGYMFRPVNKSSSGHQYSESEVLFRHWDPNIYNIYNCKQYKIIYNCKSQYLQNLQL